MEVQDGPGTEALISMQRTPNPQILIMRAPIAQMLQLP